MPYQLVVLVNSTVGSWTQEQLVTWCNNKTQFSELCSLNQSLEVTLGDGHVLEATGHGVVTLKMKLPQSNFIKCKLNDVLYVPKLSYNLLSVSKVTESGKTISFSNDGSQITGKNQKLIATAAKIGNLYHLNCHTSSHNINAAEDRNQETKENVWHQRFGHLGARYLQKLAKKKLVDGFDYNISKEIDFCESCAKRKHHVSKFLNNSCKQTREPLDLVHCDVCGKMNVPSLSGAEYRDWTVYIVTQ